MGDDTMFKIQGKDIQMNQGDFGIELPMTISNILDGDIIEFEIYESNKKNIIKKPLNYRDEKFIFELTKEETEKLREKVYLYRVIQYRDEVLQNTINEDSLFEVV